MVDPPGRAGLIRGDRTHHAMPQEDALAIGGKVVEILRNLAGD